jgi:hypothetical protein
MDWLRAHYDRAAAFAAALFLIVSCFLIFFQAFAFDARFKSLRYLARPRHETAPAPGPETAEAMQQLRTPAQWKTDHRAGLFVPERHFIADSGELVSLATTQLHPPVPNEWLDEFGLPITDSDVLAQDADGDGFTNLDEWQGRTNPTEKSSHPRYTLKLKLCSISEEPFPAVFSSSVADIFAINNIDWNQPTQFLRLGETVKGTKYRLKNYVEKFKTDRHGTRVDISELTLEEVDNHDLVTLVKEKPTISPKSVAVFLYTWNGMQQSFVVRKGQEFSLQPEEGLTYKLLEVTPEKATIEETAAPHGKIEIGHL